MNKIIEGIPFLLLCVFAPFFFFKDPNISQSIIVTAIAGLSGYRYYLNSLRQPDYVKMFEKQIADIKKENKDFRDKYGKMAMESGAKAKVKETFRW